jgi:nucleotide-binding universal stress UspA family protein
MQTIVVALSRSACTGDVLDEAIALAGDERCRLVLLHVVEPLTPPSSDDAPGDAAGQLVASAREWLQPLAAKVDATLHHGLTRVEYGDVIESILAVATEQRASHLVVGSRQRQGLARLLLGSTARAISRRAPCPVRVLRHTWRPGCPASSCQWCEDAVDPVRAALDAEAEG